MQNASSARDDYETIFGALCASILIYGALVYILAQSSASRGVPVSSQPVNDTLRFILYGAAATMLGASVVFMQISMAGKIGDSRVLAQLTTPVPLMEPAQFQTFSIIALALSEACTIIGLLLFFLGGKAEHFAFFAAGTLLVNFLFILPKGLRYWSNLEANAAGRVENNKTPFSL